MLEIRSILAPTDFSDARREGPPLRLRPGRAAGGDAAPAPRPARRRPDGPRPRRRRPDLVIAPALPPDYYRETEAESLEALGRVLDPSWGAVPSVETAVRWGDPVEEIVDYAKDTAHRPDRDRDPRPDRPRPRPARLRRRADRPRGALPGPDDPRPVDRPPPITRNGGRPVRFAPAASVAPSQIRAIADLADDYPGTLRLFYGEDTLPTPDFVKDAGRRGDRREPHLLHPQRRLPRTAADHRRAGPSAPRRRRRPDERGGRHRERDGRDQPRVPGDRRPGDLGARADAALAEHRRGHPRRRAPRSSRSRSPWPDRAKTSTSRSTSTASSGRPARHASARPGQPEQPDRLDRDRATTGPGSSRSASGTTSGSSPTASTSGSSSTARSPRAR